MPARVRSYGIGAWCWFNDPRALYLQDGRIMAGWVSGDGSIMAAVINPTSGATDQLWNVHPQFVYDDHANPAFIQTPWGFYVFYAPHAGGSIRYKLWDGTTNANAWTTTPWTLTDNVAGGSGFTYPWPIMFQGAMYLWWRGGDFQPAYRTWDGASWSTVAEFINAAAGVRPYARYAYNPVHDRIDMIYTTGHPRNIVGTPTKHAYLDAALNFRASDGTLIKALSAGPLDVDTEGTTVAAATDPDDTWHYDLAVDSAGDPVVAYVLMTGGSEQPNKQARWTACRAGAWTTPVDLGVTWNPNVPTERNYAAGLALHPTDPTVTIIARDRQANGSYAVDVERVTGDTTRTLLHRLGTVGTPMRPIFVAGEHPTRTTRFFFMEGPYPHYTTYKTGLHYANVDVTDILASADGLLPAPAAGLRPGIAAGRARRTDGSPTLIFPVAAGRAYRARVRARNAIGSGPWVTDTVTTTPTAD